MYYDPNETPACPAVRLLITDNTSGARLGPFQALIDTGADTTCVPITITDRVPNVTYTWHWVDFGDGTFKKNKFLYIVDATVEFLDDAGHVLLKGKYTDLLLQAIDNGYLGRDILNFHVCEFDGPGGQCNIR